MPCEERVAVTGVREPSYIICSFYRFRSLHFPLQIRKCKYFFSETVSQYYFVGDLGYCTRSLNQGLAWHREFFEGFFQSTQGRPFIEPG